MTLTYPIRDQSNSILIEPLWLSLLPVDLANYIIDWNFKDIIGSYSCTVLMDAYLYCWGLELPRLCFHQKQCHISKDYTCTKLRLSKQVCLLWIFMFAVISILILVIFCTLYPSQFLWYRKYLWLLLNWIAVYWKSGNAWVWGWLWYIP